METMEYTKPSGEHQQTRSKARLRSQSQAQSPLPPPSSLKLESVSAAGLHKEQSPVSRKRKRPEYEQAFTPSSFASSSLTGQLRPPSTNAEDQLTESAATPAATWMVKSSPRSERASHEVESGVVIGVQNRIDSHDVNLGNVQGDTAMKAEDVDMTIATQVPQQAVLGPPLMGPSPSMNELNPETSSLSSLSDAGDGVNTTSYEHPPEGRIGSHAQEQEAQEDSRRRTRSALKPKDAKTALITAKPATSIYPQAPKIKPQPQPQPQPDDPNRRRSARTKNKGAGPSGAPVGSIGGDPQPSDAQVAKTDSHTGDDGGGGGGQSEKEEEEEEVTTTPETRRPRKKAVDALGDPPELGPEGVLEGGTLVWAKQVGHPWFPASIHDPELGDIPQRVVDAEPQAMANLPEDERTTMQIVRFYDKSYNWGWVPLKWIRLLFEDDNRDKHLLTGKAKSDKARSAVRAAYRRAQQAKEALDDGAEAAGLALSAVTSPTEDIEDNKSEVS